MATLDRPSLKETFETGDFPTEMDFSALIDSTVNKVEDYTPTEQEIIDLIRANGGVEDFDASVLNTLNTHNPSILRVRELAQLEVRTDTEIKGVTINTIQTDPTARAEIAAIAVDAVDIPPGITEARVIELIAEHETPPRTDEEINALIDAKIAEIPGVEPTETTVTRLRKSADSSAGILTLDWESANELMLDAVVTLENPTTMSHTNNVNMEFLTMTMRCLNGSETLVLPLGADMQQYEHDNGKYDAATRTYTPGVAGHFELSMSYVGTTQFFKIGQESL